MGIYVLKASAIRQLLNESFPDVSLYARAPPLQFQDAQETWTSSISMAANSAQVQGGGV